MTETYVCEQLSQSRYEHWNGRPGVQLTYIVTAYVQALTERQFVAKFNCPTAARSFALFFSFAICFIIVLIFPVCHYVGISLYLLTELQSVMNSAARLVFLSSRYDHVTPLFRLLGWLKARRRTEFKFAVLVYKCQLGAAPSYLPMNLASRRTS